LVGFAWGCSHGTYATYEAGASSPREDLRKTPLSYAPIWDLVTWASSETTAQWFDLGGVSLGGDDDTQSGISEFKRHLSEDLIEVGGEWTLEPHPTRAAIALALGRAAQWASGLTR
jgi:lipid II:glycine glycyltransferase (peptidoglycan interpeptide bridge formation enzyme)